MVVIRAWHRSAGTTKTKTPAPISIATVHVCNPPNTHNNNNNNNNNDNNIINNKTSRDTLQAGAGNDVLNEADECGVPDVTWSKSLPSQNRAPRPLPSCQTSLTTHGTSQCESSQASQKAK